MSNLTAMQVQSAKNVACEKCSNEVFNQTFVIKQVSGLVTETGKDMMAPIPIFSCAKCGNVNAIFVKDLNIKTETETSTLHVQV
jgi:hypothetical protein